MVRLNGWVEPGRLLSALQTIEQAAGRARGAPNAPRTLDLDIIDMGPGAPGDPVGGGLVRAAPDPILPHPRAHLRAFVLHPLRDVAPRWRHPASGITVQRLIDALPPQDIHAL